MNLSQFAPYGMALPAIREQQQYMQQQQAMRIAAQRMAQMQAQGQQPGFAAMPQQGANAGTPMQMPPGAITGPNGAPLPPQGGTGMPPGATTGPNGAPLPAVMPFSPGAQQAPSGDPFSYPQMMNAFFGGGGNKGPEDFLAWQDAEKTVRPYGQMQSRLEQQGMRDTSAMAKTVYQEAHRDSRAYQSIAAQARKADGVDLGRMLTSYTNTANNFRNNPQSMKTTEGQKAYQDAIDGEAAIMDAIQNKRKDVGMPPRNFKGAGSSTGGKAEVPPAPGAKKAPDGNWYVETSPGKFAKVITGADTSGGE
jgi:hypothetical protein